MGAFFKMSSLTSFQSFYEICLAILYMKGNLSTSCGQMAVELPLSFSSVSKWLTGWKQMQHTQKKRQEEEIDEVCETE